MNHHDNIGGTRRQTWRTGELYKNDGGALNLLFSEEPLVGQSVVVVASNKEANRISKSARPGISLQ